MGVTGQRMDMIVWQKNTQMIRFWRMQTRPKTADLSCTFDRQKKMDKDVRHIRLNVCSCICVVEVTIVCLMNYRLCFLFPDWTFTLLYCINMLCKLPLPWALDLYGAGGSGLYALKAQRSQVHAPFLLFPLNHYTTTAVPSRNTCYLVQYNTLSCLWHH